MADDRIRVLHFTNTGVRAGVEEHILTLLRGFDRSRFKLGLVCPDELIGKLNPDVPPDVDVAGLTLEQPHQLGAAVQLARFIRRWRPDVFHSHLFQSSRPASPIAWISRVPAIVETTHVRERWRQGWLTRSFVIDRFVSRFVDCYIAVSESNARYLTDEKGIAPDKVTVIRNGVDLRRFDPERCKAAGLRNSLGFDDQSLVIAVVGRLESQKGHRVFIDALVEVTRGCPGVRAVLVGEGALRSELENQVRSLNLEHSVYFAGYQKNPENWLAMADIAVLPSHYEGLPIAAIESLAVATPVVATAVDGTPEVVVNEKTGLTVPPENPAALASAILRLLGDAALRQRLGEAGRRWVEDGLSQEQQVSKTQELYLRALSGRGADGYGEPSPSPPSESADAAKYPRRESMAASNRTVVRSP